VPNDSNPDTSSPRVDSVRTDFVANLSHELKTPIGGIAALADTMIGEVDPQVIQRLTGRIVDESYRLSHIIDDLLDLSRIEFGAADYWEPVALTDVVNEVVARLQHEGTRAGITIQATRPVGVMVVGDRSQLVSALDNLVSNAIKYSGSGTTVIVDTRATTELVSISVIDQGIGIAAKDHQRIFERFYRVDKARSRSTGGSGLGLSIVRHVVSNHGGTVSVASEEGRGSTFTIVLPCAARTDSAKVEPTTDTDVVAHSTIAPDDHDEQTTASAPTPERNLTR
jgi:two-component system sensor histidine kinase SenX3